MPVVLLDIEGDQLPNGRNAVERVEIQPLVLEDSPPGFDERVRELDLRLGKERFRRLDATT